jgi:SNF2 family DNA or RNA helicase
MLLIDPCIPARIIPARILPALILPALILRSPPSCPSLLALRTLSSSCCTATPTSVHGHWQWLYGLYEKKVGGILGDDMGLGKTVQILCFISAVLGKTATLEDRRQLRRRRTRRREEACGRLKKVKKVKKVKTVGADAAGEEALMQADDDADSVGVILVIVPTTIVANWENECKVWGCFEVMTLSGKQDAKEKVVKAAQDGQVEIVITSYEQLAKSEEMQDVEWHVIILDEMHRLKVLIDCTLYYALYYALYSLFILDEMHRLKNPSANGTKVCNALRCKHCKIGLTGTLMQNCHEELWALMNLVNENGLGVKKHFMEYYAKVCIDCTIHCTHYALHGVLCQGMHRLYTVLTMHCTMPRY